MWLLDFSLLLHSYNVAENDQISIPSPILSPTKEPVIFSAITALKSIRKVGVQKFSRPSHQGTPLVQLKKKRKNQDFKQPGPRQAYVQLCTPEEKATTGLHRYTQTDALQRRPPYAHIWAALAKNITSTRTHRQIGPDHHGLCLASIKLNLLIEASL